MATIKNFEDLECWQEARELVKLVFTMLNDDVFKRQFALDNQIKRAVLSVMNNIAEGFGRKSNKEFIRFIDISIASLFEVKSMCYVLLDLKLITDEEQKLLFERIEKTKSLTLGLSKYLHQNVRNS